MLTHIRQMAVIARNYLVYRQYHFWAVRSKVCFPLNPGSDFVISVASYPGRIHFVPAVFESLARQTVHPRYAYLVLSEEDFPDRRLPGFIDKLVERGIQIAWTVGNPYAVKKLVSIWDLNPDLAVCTLDDDIIYSPLVFEGLQRQAGGRERIIVGYWAKWLYRKDQTLKMFFREVQPDTCEKQQAQIYLMGGGGVWYAPNALHPFVADLSAIRKIVPGRGSDIWFWAAAVAAGAVQVCVESKGRSRMWIPIPQRKKSRPRETPGQEVLEQRFQMAIDYFGIREKLIRQLPDRS